MSRRVPRGGTGTDEGSLQFDDQRDQVPGQEPGDPAPSCLPTDGIPIDGVPPDGVPPGRKVRFRRTRRLFRRRSVRVVSAAVALCLVWLMFSVGQAAFKNN